MTKVATNTRLTSTKKYAIKYFFNTFMISVKTSFYKKKKLIISYQHEKVAMLWFSAVPEGNKLKQD